MNRLGAGALVLVAACATAPTVDEGLRDQLVGKWGEAHHLQTAHMEQSFQLSPDGTARIEVTMQVGSSAESVTITADAPLLKTESAEQSYNIATEQINALPLNFKSLSNSDTADCYFD